MLPLSRSVLRARSHIVPRHLSSTRLLSTNTTNNPPSPPPPPQEQAGSSGSSSSSGGGGSSRSAHALWILPIITFALGTWQVQRLQEKEAQVRCVYVLARSLVEPVIQPVLLHQILLRKTRVEATPIAISPELLDDPYVCT
jgi:hypothetical protein